MNKKNIIEKTVSLDNYLCSVDGYKVYDLMQNILVSNGHGQKLERWGASGTVFYTTDDSLVKEVDKIRRGGNIDEIKQLLLSHKDEIHDLNVLNTNGLNLMSDKQFKAFQHLCDSEVRKDTLKNAYYGSAHLVEDDKILFFYQNALPIRDSFNNKNLNIQKNYLEAQEVLLKAYKSGKVEPDGELTGGARDKIMNALLDINFVNLSNFQKEIVLLLQEFNDSVLVDTKFNTSIKGQKHVASFTQGKKSITAEIPKLKNEEFVVQQNGQTNNIKKLSDLLSYVSKEISQEQVNSFLKRKKI